MTFQDYVNTKTSGDIHALVDYKALQDEIRIYGFKSKEDLVKHIEEKTAELNSWLLKNNSTGIRAVQDVSNKIMKLEQLKSWKRICDDFL